MNQLEIVPLAIPFRSGCILWLTETDLPGGSGARVSRPFGAKCNQSSHAILLAVTIPFARSRTERLDDRMIGFNRPEHVLPFLVTKHLLCVSVTTGRYVRCSNRELQS